MHTVSTDAQAFNSTSSFINQLSNRLPISTTTLLIAWFLFSDNLRIDKDAAIKYLNPTSFYFHFIVGSCGTVMKHATITAKLLRAALINISWLKQNKKDEVVEDEDDDDDEGKKIKVEQLSDFIRQFTTDRVHGCKGKHDAYETSECVYANNGDLGHSLQTKSMPVDSRRLIARPWFERHLGSHFNYQTFMGPDLYARGQLGIMVADYTGEREQTIAGIFSSKTHVMKTFEKVEAKNLYSEKQPTSLDDLITGGTGRKVTSLFSLINKTSGEDRTLMSNSRLNELIDKQQTALYQDIIKKTKTLLDITCLTGVDLTKEGDFSVCANMLSNCLWCNLIVIPEIRATFFDLVQTARKKIKQVANTSESGIKKCETLLFHRTKAPQKRVGGNIAYNKELKPGSRKAYSREQKGAISGRVVIGGIKKMTAKEILGLFNEGVHQYDNETVSEICNKTRDENEIYTYGFDALTINRDALFSCFDEWCLSKFPFLAYLPIYYRRRMSFARSIPAW